MHAQAALQPTRCTQGGFWAHQLVASGARLLQPTRSLVFMMSFLAFFSIVIALFKDIPDVAGDERNDIHTASVRFGVKRIFWSCIGLLYAAYAGAMGFIAVATSGTLRIALLGSQLAAVALLRHQAHRVDLTQHSSIVGMYMFIWKLFYAQYLVFPLLA